MSRDHFLPLSHFLPPFMTISPLPSQVDLTSNTYLSHAASGGASPHLALQKAGGAGEGGLLAQHRTDISEYLRPAAVVAAAESSDRRDAEEERRVHATLQVGTRMCEAWYIECLDAVVIGLHEVSS